MRILFLTILYDKQRRITASLCELSCLPDPDPGDPKRPDLDLGDPKRPDLDPGDPKRPDPDPQHCC